jgi:hypothetical protein
MGRKHKGLLQTQVNYLDRFKHSRSFMGKRECHCTSAGSFQLSLNPMAGFQNRGRGRKEKKQKPPPQLKANNVGVSKRDIIVNDATRTRGRQTRSSSRKNFLRKIPSVAPSSPPPLFSAPTHAPCCIMSTLQVWVQSDVSLSQNQELTVSEFARHRALQPHAPGPCFVNNLHPGHL